MNRLEMLWRVASSDTAQLAVPGGHRVEVPSEAREPLAVAGGHRIELRS